MMFMRNLPVANYPVRFGFSVRRISFLSLNYSGYTRPGIRANEVLEAERSEFHDSYMYSEKVSS